VILAAIGFLYNRPIVQNHYSNEETFITSEYEEQELVEIPKTKSVDAENNSAPTGHPLVSEQKSLIFKSRYQDLVIEMAHSSFTSIFLDELSREDMQFGQNLFSPAFYSEGYYDNLIAGNIEILQNIGLENQVSTLLVGSLDVDSERLDDQKVTSQASCSLKVIKVTDNTMGSLSRAANGIGFSEVQASENAIRNLARLVASELN
jgi:hypothetical protein